MPITAPEPVARRVTGAQDLTDTDGSIVAGGLIFVATARTADTTGDLILHRAALCGAETSGRGVNLGASMEPDTCRSGVDCGVAGPRPSCPRPSRGAGGDAGGRSPHRTSDPRQPHHTSDRWIRHTNGALTCG